jgi:hypothetical protein
MEMVSENEPSELKAILQTLGFSSEEKPKAKRELKGPLAMLPITACGSLLTAAHLIYLARNQLEEFLRLLGEPQPHFANLDLSWQDVKISFPDC